MSERQQIQDAVQEKYGAIAKARGAVGCCGPAPCGCGDPITTNLYSDEETGLVPDTAVAVSLGCGNPTALAALQPGQTVLDLGSGGGIDVLLSARRVGPTGRAYGVDMTAEMLELARANQVEAGSTNAEFLEGRIEAVPLPDHSVDVVVSNCVINLSADKPAVFAEAHRVLRPGGRIAVADIAADQETSPELRADDAAWAACIAGAVTRDRYRSQLADAGFIDIEIVDSHQVADGFWSAFWLHAFTGLCQGGTYTPALALINDNIERERRGRAMGYFIAGSSAGYAICLGVAGLALEMNLGYWPGGTLPRDLLEISRQVDRWGLLGLPLLISLTSASEEGPDPQAASSEPAIAGGISPLLSPRGQAEVVEQLVPLLLSKSSVHGIIWSQLDESHSHDFAHGGLVDAQGNPKPAFARLAEIRKEHVA